MWEEIRMVYVPRPKSKKISADWWTICLIDNCACRFQFFEFPCASECFHLLWRFIVQFFFLSCPDLARWSLAFGHLLPSLLVPFAGTNHRSIFLSNYFTNGGKDNAKRIFYLNRRCAQCSPRTSEPWHEFAPSTVTSVLVHLIVSGSQRQHDKNIPPFAAHTTFSLKKLAIIYRFSKDPAIEQQRLESNAGDASAEPSNSQPARCIMRAPLRPKPTEVHPPLRIKISHATLKKRTKNLL